MNYIRHALARTLTNDLSSELPPLTRGSIFYAVLSSNFPEPDKYDEFNSDSMQLFADPLLQRPQTMAQRVCESARLPISPVSEPN